MPRRLSRVLVAAILFGVAVIASTMSPAAAQPGGPPHPANVHRACAWPPKRGHMACMAFLRTDTKKNLGVRPAATGLTEGYLPADLQDAYNLPSWSAGSGQTVAIVDAYDDPQAESDMAVYRSSNGMPACTTANGCFKKVYASGSRPPTDGGWAAEISLDLDMVSAICPYCNIELIEAAAATNAGLAQAETVAMNDSSVRYISNSWGALEYFADPSAFPFGSRPGVAVTASSGDDGYGVLFPANNPNVIAVGGTSMLHATTSRGWAEIAWTGTGSGCSQLSAKPSWQNDSGCDHRTVTDVAAVADPHTGVYLYDTEPNGFGCDGWCVAGGTSASAPIIAAVYALAGSPPANAATSLYDHPGSLNDILGGTNSFDPCYPLYLCQSDVGYDGPTGLGTPNGLGAFR